MAKAYQQKKIERNGVKYTLQGVPYENWIRLQSDSVVNGKTDLVGMYKFMLENIVVEPKGLTMDDFESPNDLSEFMNEVIEFQQFPVKPETEK